MEESCEYELEYSFKFDDNLPVPNDPAMQCDPQVQPPVLAPDGKPYYATREFTSNWICKYWYVYVSILRYIIAAHIIYNHI